MKRRALVILMAGDPEMGGAIVDGIVRQVIPLNSAELDAMHEELKKLRAREGTRQYRQRKDWNETCADLQRKYGVKQHGPVYQYMLVCWTLTCLTIAECCRRIANRMKEGRS